MWEEEIIAVRGRAVNIKACWTSWDETRGQKSKASRAAQEKQQGRLSLGCQASSLKVSFIYFLPCVCSYLWLSLGAALLWVRLLLRVIFITLELIKAQIKWSKRITPGSVSVIIFNPLNPYKSSVIVWTSLTSWVQKETPVERLFSRGRLRSRMERGWDLSSPSFSSSLLSISVQTEKNHSRLTSLTVSHKLIFLDLIFYLCFPPVWK